MCIRDSLLPEGGELSYYRLFTVTLVQSESSCFHIPAVGADHHSEISRLRYQLQVIIVRSQPFLSNLEMDNLHFTRFEKYLLKTFQLFHRTGTAADDVADIRCV